VERRLARETETFDPDEVGEIIAIAAEIGAGSGERLDYADLRRVASELGIGEAAVAGAVARLARERRRERREVRRRVRRRLRFLRHVLVYVVVVAALLLVDVLGGGGWWAPQVGALWGAAVAIHGLRFLTRRDGPLERRWERRALGR
jgi:hypothetical protein